MVHKLKELVAQLGLEVLAGKKLLDRPVQGGYASDLLSCVMKGAGKDVLLGYPSVSFECGGGSQFAGNGRHRHYRREPTGGGNHSPGRRGSCIWPPPERLLPWSDNSAWE